jgi:hypothetical protein
VLRFVVLGCALFVCVCFGLLCLAVMCWMCCV